MERDLGRSSRSALPTTPPPDCERHRAQYERDGDGGAHGPDNSGHLDARARGGSGLGLAIVDAIARAHGGKAGARNRDGGGVDVWIELPNPPP
jgi:hypothetical protein